MRSEEDANDNESESCSLSLDNSDDDIDDINDIDDDDDDIPILVNLDECPNEKKIPQDLDKEEEKEQALPTPAPNSNVNPAIAPIIGTSTSTSSKKIVPVTILTGFLGSGKTTLIQYILSSPDHGKKIAVIENEFSGAGAKYGNGMRMHGSNITTTADPETEGLAIETLIARDGSSNENNNLMDLIELPNGCVCCTVKDSLVSTLEMLLQKQRAQELDYIIIECSGMANPGPIASIFWSDDDNDNDNNENDDNDANNGNSNSRRLRLDGIVACVDARNLDMQLRETSSVAWDEGGNGDGAGGDEAAQQIAFADRIIVNKIDLLGDANAATADCTAKSIATTDVNHNERIPVGRTYDNVSNSNINNPNNSEKLNQVLDQIRTINGTAPVQLTTYSQIPNLDWILDAKCFDSERAQDVLLLSGQSLNVFTRSGNDGGHVDSTGEGSNRRTKREGTSGNTGSVVGSTSTSTSSKLRPLYDGTDPNPIQYCSPCSPPLSTSFILPPRQGKVHHLHTNAIKTIALVERGSVSLPKIHMWLASILWPDQDEQDAVLTAQLHEIEQMMGGKTSTTATTQELIERRKRKEIEEKKMLIFRIKGVLSVYQQLENLQNPVAAADTNDRYHGDDENDMSRQHTSIDQAGKKSHLNVLDDRKFIVQAVNDLWDINPASTWQGWKEDGSEERVCKIVLIGRNLDFGALNDGFKSCFL